MNDDTGHGHEPRVGDAYHRQLRAAFERIESDANAEPMTSPFAGASPGVVASVTDHVTGIGDQIVALAHDLHAEPELGYAEHRSADKVAALLGNLGHDATVGVAGLATAVRAVHGTGSPRVGVIAEYDALPGIGHACGHNLIAACAVGAFAAASEQIGDGSVVLLGTPAEEGGGGKELMAREGVFDDLDMVVMVHPSGWDVAAHPWLGVRQVKVHYRGAAAHAAVSPFLGLNALDAVVTAYNGIAQLRQHLLPTDRVHGIITDGGQRPNIVPEQASAWFYLRSAELETLDELTRRAAAVFRGAAEQTGTHLTLEWDPTPTYLPVRNNLALAARYSVHQAARGRRVLPAGVVPEHFTGSTDLGNVSQRIPAIHPMIASAPADVMIHTPEFARWAVSDLADRAVVDGAIALAMTMLDYAHDPELRAAVDAEFLASGGRFTTDDLVTPEG